MNRQEKRHPKENRRRIQTNEEIAYRTAQDYITNTAKLINECYFKAMRNNGISIIRANKILEQTEDIIKLEANKNC